MEKIVDYFDKGMEYLLGAKSNPKKAAKFFIKSLKLANKLKAYERSLAAILKLIECYHKKMEKPKLALPHVENFFKLMMKARDYENAVNIQIETARMLREYPNLIDEAIERYYLAWKISNKYSLDEDIKDLIKREVYETVIMMGQSEDYARNYIETHFVTH